MDYEVRIESRIPPAPQRPFNSATTSLMNEWDEITSEDEYVPMPVWDDEYASWFSEEKRPIESDAESEGKTWRPKSLGPIYKLPLEMLSMVLVASAALDWKAPCRDGLVCRLWREALLNAPQAWAYFQIEPGKYAITPGTVLWLTRAGKAPMHLRRVVLPSLLPYCGNLQGLNYLGSIQHLAVLVLSNLRTLSFGRVLQPATISQLLQFAPSLRTLDLHEYSPFKFITPNTPMHPTIRNLHINLDDGALGLIHLLSPVLQTLCIRYQSQYIILGNIDLSIHLPRLTKLTIVQNGSHSRFEVDLMQFLNHLVTPNLHILHEHGLYNTSLLDYTLRSTIEEYTSGAPPTRDANQGVSLTLIPRIRRLKLLMPLPMAKEYISQLASRPDLCPHLEYLEILVRPRPDDQTLFDLEVIKSREHVHTVLAPFLPVTYWKTPGKFVLASLECEDSI